MAILNEWRRKRYRKICYPDHHKEEEEGDMHVSKSHIWKIEY
jgi:hypothetical protein